MGNEEIAAEDEAMREDIHRCALAGELSNSARQFAERREERLVGGEEIET